MICLQWSLSWNQSKESPAVGLFRSQQKVGRCRRFVLHIQPSCDLRGLKQWKGGASSYPKKPMTLHQVTSASLPNLLWIILFMMCFFEISIQLDKEAKAMSLFWCDVFDSFFGVEAVEAVWSVFRFIPMARWSADFTTLLCLEDGWKLVHRCHHGSSYVFFSTPKRIQIWDVDIFQQRVWWWKRWPAAGT